MNVICEHVNVNVFCVFHSYSFLNTHLSFFVLNLGLLRAQERTEMDKMCRSQRAERRLLRAKRVQFYTDPMCRTV